MGRHPLARGAANGGQVESSTRSGNTAPPDQTWSTSSKAYLTATGEQIGSPNARYLQWRAVLTSTAASPVLTSVTAAYLPAQSASGDALDHRPSARHRLPATVLEWRPRDRRFPGQHTGWPSRIARPGPGAAPHSAAASIRKVFRPSSGRPKTATTIGCESEVSYRREGETALAGAAAGVVGSDLRLGHHLGARGYLLREGDGHRCPVQRPRTALVGELETTSFDIDNTPPRVEVQPSARAGNRTSITFFVRDEQSPGAARRVYRSTPAAGASSTRKTASRTRGARSSKLCSRKARPAAA